MSNPGKTAIHRKAASAPLKWILAHMPRPARGSNVLDYGCGHGKDTETLARSIGVDSVAYGWDPIHRPWDTTSRTGFFDVITCTYVLNVLTEREQDLALVDISRLLAPGGVAYITVRRDIPEQGAKGRGGVWQRYVDLPGFELVKRTNSYAIYRAKKGGAL